VAYNDVKGHNCCQRTVHVTQLLTCTLAYRSCYLSNRKTGHRIVRTSIRFTTSVWRLA